MKLFCQAIIIATVGMVPPSCSLAAGPAEPPLPTLQEIFPRVVERALQEPENDRRFESQFAFVKSKVTEHRNSSGEIKKREAKVSTNSPAWKPLAEPPAPVTDRDPAVARPVSNRPAKGRGKSYERDELLASGEFVKRFAFTLVGRETLHGRPALVVDFVPAAGKLPEHNLKDKFINRTAGRVWLDEADMAIVRGALRLTGRVNIVGGLVGAVSQLTVGFERERTAEGFWFTREANWHLEAREVFAQRVMDYHEERTEVRRAQ